VTKAGILHRDISIGNILILPDGTGILIDWELSKSMDDKVARTHERTVGQLSDDYVLNIIDVSWSYQGTWQFLSVALVRARAKDLFVTHEVIDDLESFVHVLAWICIRRAANKLDAADRNAFLKIFDGGPQDWTLKRSRFREGAAAIISLKLERIHLRKLLEELWVAFGRRYCSLAEGEIDSEDVDVHAQEAMKASLDLISSHDWARNVMKKALENEEWEVIVGDGCVDHAVQGSQRSLTANQLAIINRRELKRKGEISSYQGEFRNEKRYRSSTE
jgi:hypothetical protein